MKPDERKRTEAALGDKVICDRCGCTLATYDEQCEAYLAERCPGFEAIEAASKAQP